MREVKTEDSLDIEEDVFDGEDELNQVTEPVQHHVICLLTQADFKEAEDGSEKKMVRYIFKVR